MLIEISIVLHQLNLGFSKCTLENIFQTSVKKNLYSLRIAKNLSLGKNMLEFSEKSLSLARSLSLFRLEFSEKC